MTAKRIPGVPVAAVLAVTALVLLEAVFLGLGVGVLTFALVWSYATYRIAQTNLGSARTVVISRMLLQNVMWYALAVFTLWKVNVPLIELLG